jgi:hypothetical protein
MTKKRTSQTARKAATATRPRGRPKADHVWDPALHAYVSPGPAGKQSARGLRVLKGDKGDPAPQTQELSDASDGEPESSSALVNYFAAGSIRSMQEQLKAKKMAVPTHIYAVEELTEAQRDLEDTNKLEGRRKGLGTALSNLIKVVNEKGSELAEANADYSKAKGQTGSLECKIAALLYNQKQAKTAEALADLQTLKIHLEKQAGYRAADQKISIVIKKFEGAQDALKTATEAVENMRQELITIQEEIDDTKKSMKRHIAIADDNIRALGQTGTALINKDIGASQLMDWGEEVLEAADDAAEEVEEYDGELVRTRSETFLDAEQEDYQYKKYVYIDADDTMQGPFSEDQMRGWFSAGYFNHGTKVSTWADGDPLGDWQNAGTVFGASPTRRSSSPPRRAGGRPSLQRHNAMDPNGQQQPQRKKPRMKRTQAVNPRFEPRGLEQASVDNFFGGSNR